MPSQREKPVGPPRLDRNERLRHRFYEPLLLLNMLNPARGAANLLPTVNQHSFDFLPRWREFLDALSFFCDYGHGGSTVASVAAEETPGGSRFWLASSEIVPLEHLKWILESLEAVASQTTMQQALTRTNLVETSILFSKDKVQNYRSTLARKFEKARQATRSELMEEAGDVSQALMAVISHRNPLELCQAAMAFHEDQALTRLVNATTEIRSPSPWADIRHCIMRLRSWHRKADMLLQFAQQFPGMLSPHSCEWLGLPAGIPLPASDNKTNLLSALKRMLSSTEQDLALPMREALDGLRDFNFETVFEENFSRSTSLLVHPEVFLMEHFYLNGLRFAENDRYIGCSKPSCYCCSLYMRYHPGNHVIRPCHGNAWVTWNPPLQAKLEDERICKHHFAVMNKVVEHLRRDVFIEMEHRFPRRLKRPDSTSGFGTRSL